MCSTRIKRITGPRKEPGGRSAPGPESRRTGSRSPSSRGGTAAPSSPDGPSEMRGIDASAGFTLRDGQVLIFARIDHCSAFCLGIHVAKHGTWFETLEPLRQVVRELFDGFSEGIALGVGLRHDHGSQFMSDDFQREIRSLAPEGFTRFRA